MPRTRRSFAFVLFGCAAALACDDRRPEPTSPAPSLNASGGGARAGGHADIHATTVQNIRDEKYSFTAIADGAPPAAKGELEAHFLAFTGQEFDLHAEVTCLSVVGPDAWIGARVRRYLMNGQELLPPGSPLAFRVRDMGEGRATPDLASLLFFGLTAGGDLAYCNTRPAFPLLFPSDNGNIQVWPG